MSVFDSPKKHYDPLAFLDAGATGPIRQPSQWVEEEKEDVTDVAGAFNFNQWYRKNYVIISVAQWIVLFIIIIKIFKTK